MSFWLLLTSYFDILNDGAGLRLRGGAKSKNHTAHNKNSKEHRNGIKRVKTYGKCLQRVKRNLFLESLLYSFICLSILPAGTETRRQSFAPSRCGATPNTREKALCAFIAITCRYPLSLLSTLVVVQIALACEIRTCSFPWAPSFILDSAPAR